jgi:glutaredoxin-like YruB-family protein
VAEIPTYSRALPLGVSLVLLALSSGCDEIAGLIDEASAISEPEAPPFEPRADDEGEDDALPARPADSVARSEESVITFASILNDREMSRAERIRAFENLDPGALQKRVAQPNVSGAPATMAPTRGTTTSSDTPPTPKTSRPDVPIVMFSTSWCGVCKRARQYFQEQGIPFTEYDVDRNAQARNEYLLLNPRRSVPTIKIGDRVVVGFSPASVEAAIQAAGR